jgi:hypothetical protein
MTSSWESLEARNQSPMGTSDPQTLSEQLEELNMRYPQLLQGKEGKDDDV